MLKLEFTNEEHEQNFVELLRRDKTFKEDFYRIPFFYLLSSNITYSDINAVYDFTEGCITRFDIINEGFFTSGTLAITKLAIALFNGYNYGDSIVDLLGNMDDKRYKMALTAIDMRMRGHEHKQAIGKLYVKHKLDHKPVRYY